MHGAQGGLVLIEASWHMGVVGILALRTNDYMGVQSSQRLTDVAEP